jgi:hypothetical protein
MQLSASAPYDCTLLLSSDIGEKAAGLDLSEKHRTWSPVDDRLHTALACLPSFLSVPAMLIKGIRSS